MAGVVGPPIIAWQRWCMAWCELGGGELLKERRSVTMIMFNTHKIQSLNLEEIILYAEVCGV